MYINHHIKKNLQQEEMPSLYMWHCKNMSLLPISAGLLGNRATGEEAACTYISQLWSTHHLWEQLCLEVFSGIAVKRTPSSISCIIYNSKTLSELVKPEKTTSLQNRITSAAYSGFYIFYCKCITSTHFGQSLQFYACLLFNI